MPIIQSVFGALLTKPTHKEIMQKIGLNNTVIA
jgi:hypothetical protein